PAKNLFYRTSEINIDKVVAGIYEVGSRFAELFRPAAHERTADGMIVLTNPEDPFSKLAMDEHDLVEHHFRHCEFGTVAPRHDAHRSIGKSGERCSNGRKSDLKFTDF